MFERSVSRWNWKNVLGALNRSHATKRARSRRPKTIMQMIIGARQPSLW